MMYGLFAFFASLGFAVLFNIRKDKLLAAGIAGLSGGISYQLVLSINNNEALALFIASLVLTTISYIFAHLLHAPVTTFLICALIPLVPGGGMYYTMLAIIQSNTSLAISLGINTIVQACSIVIGVILVSSLSILLNNKH